MKYRIMNEKEMIEKHGKNWREITGMPIRYDYLLGRGLSTMDTEEILGGTTVEIDDWYITYKDIIEIKEDYLRVKTEQEMIHDFGKDWRKKVWYSCVNWAQGKDIILGVELTKYHIENIKTSKYCLKYGYDIDKEMTTDKPLPEETKYNPEDITITILGRDIRGFTLDELDKNKISVTEYNQLMIQFVKEYIFCPESDIPDKAEDIVKLLRNKFLTRDKLMLERLK